jgi:peroxiredoxin
LKKDYGSISALDAEILAVSTDNMDRAEHALEYLDLGFPILFDLEIEVVESYGVYNLLRDRLATPSVFIIDKRYTDRPTNGQIIAPLEAIQASEPS